MGKEVEVLRRLHTTHASTNHELAFELTERTQPFVPVSLREMPKYLFAKNTSVNEIQVNQILRKKSSEISRSDNTGQQDFCVKLQNVIAKRIQIPR